MPLFHRRKIAVANLILRDQKKYGQVQKGVQTYVFKEDIFYYVASFNLTKLSKALDEDPNLINKQNEKGFSLLYLACRMGYGDIVQYLLEKTKDINQRCKKGSTPLHISSSYGHYKIVEFLLLNNANRTIKNDKNKLPEDKAYTKKIQILFKQFENKIDRIAELIRVYIEEGLYESAYKLYVQDDNGVERCSSYFCQINYNKNPVEKKKIDEFYENIDNYELAYHGTKLRYTKNIIESSFKKPSERGEKFGVEEGHIKLGVTLDGIENWADAVFLTQSVYMAMSNVYGEEINTCPLYQKMCREPNHETFSYLFQVLVKKNCYFGRGHTLGKDGYIKQKDEPDELEWRVDKTDNIAINGIYYTNNYITQEILKSHTKAKQFHSEITRTSSNIQNQQITKCLKQHQMEQQENERVILECDTCGEKASKYLVCDICQFIRCIKCIKDERYLP